MNKNEAFRIRGNKCEECGLDGVWNGKPIRMHFHDHKKDSNKLLCPNCHSQTDTYCGRTSWKNENARIAFYERHSKRMKQNNPMQVSSFREKLSQAKKGKPLSDEHRQKISEAIKRKKSEKN